MKKSILFSVLVAGTTLLQAQSITVHQTCGQNGQVVKAIPPEAAQALDLGLSVKWANMNVGAESPEDYGNYYVWGETSTKDTYSWDTYFDTNDGGNTFTKYNNEGGKTVLEPEDDAAHVNWGGSWRMPTEAEWQELRDNCTWTWTTQNGINGYKVTSNKAGYTDKFIFLPAAGYRGGSGLNRVGSYGYYWSSSLSGGSSYSAWRLGFNSGSHFLSNSSRYSGPSVRPVLLPSSISYSSSANDTIRIYSNGCDDYQTFIGSHGGQLTMTANSDQWSHFVRWQDGNTDNPRTITTNGNANYTAYFEAYKYSVQVQSNDAARGSGYISKVVKESTIEYNKSAGTFDAGSEVFLAYQANYGYHFVKWSDGNTSQQRSFILTKDTTFTATFAKNVYSITKNAEHGSISGNTSAEYLDEVTLTVSSDYGYHFSKWSDGNTDNPRTITLTSDTTFTAQFVKNSYTISTNSANPEWGTTAGDTAALYLDEVEISAIPNYGYHFVRWNDYNTSNPRTVSVTEDKIFTATFAKNVYSITKNAEHGSISGNNSAEYLDFVTLTVTPDYGYHFVQWSDGLKDNPRIFQITKDTAFVAQFAKNTYTISLQPDMAEHGSVSGAGTFEYLDEKQIEATANYGYHFDHWSDWNTQNPRTITVTEDQSYQAFFAKNVYNIAKNAEHGTISGNSSAEYLDFVTLTVTPDYGYHFTQWSDGLKDNPRIAQITQDTTFTAEFAYDRVGTCGKDLALVWSYDPNAKVLTIGNAGEFTENMQFGVEAPAEMEELVIGNNVTAIGENAFSSISTLKKITIGESVKTIYDRAFYNCVNLETIFNYRPTPTNAYSTAFDGVDKFECILYVLPNSIDMYKNASVWRDFYYTYAIGAEEATVTTNDVQVEPQDNAATLTWPTSNEAFSYTIEITKDGVVFCRLTFNANGQLTGIAFAPGRDGQSMAPAAVMTANGLQFTVTGLNSNTQYGYSLTAKDANEQPIATYSGSFTTTSEGIATGVDNTAVESEITKILRNGEVFILRDGKTYTVQGQEVR
jgi:hypothetical protein